MGWTHKTDAAKKRLSWPLLLEFPTAVLLVPILWLTTLLPRRCRLAIADAAGYVGWLLHRRRRLIVHRNLDIAFGDSKSTEEKSHIGQRAFQYSARSVATVVSECKLASSPETIDALVHSSPDVDRLITGCTDQPTAVLGGHFGDWEMGHIFLQHRGLKLVVVAKKLRNRVLNALLKRRRESRGGFIPNAGALGKLRALLRERRNVALLPDQNARSRGRFFNFFDVAASTHFEWARLLMRSGYRVVFMACVWNRDGSYYFHAKEILALGTSAPTTKIGRREAADKLVKRYLQALEEAIRQHPDQYLWLHRRWKSRPTHSPWLYDLTQPLDQNLVRRHPEPTR